jgi:hypothetical protein
MSTAIFVYSSCLECHEVDTMRIYYKVRDPKTNIPQLDIRTGTQMYHPAKIVAKCKADSFRDIPDPVSVPGWCPHSLLNDKDIKKIEEGTGFKLVLQE